MDVLANPKRRDLSLIPSCVTFPITKLLTALSLLCVLLAAPLALTQEQPIQKGERAAAGVMLSDIKDELKSKYYDPKFHGVDIDARYKDASERIAKATSLNQAFGVIAWFMEALHDSHTFFLPPPRPYILEQGWRMQMIGDACYVTAVRAGSDAEKKGLTPGDQVLTVNNLSPTRTDLRKIEYLFQALRPQPGLQLQVRDLQGKERTLGVAFHIRETRRLSDPFNRDIWDGIRLSEKIQSLNRRSSVVVGDTIVWKFPSFMVDEQAADAMMGQSMKYKSMVVDLRGNSGGSVDTLLHLIRHFFDHDVKVTDVQLRTKTETSIAKSRGPVFSGKVVVLIDSQSGSASELFARVAQLEKRGVVVGDQSAGAVMQADLFPHHVTMNNTMILFAAQITRANLVMSDGRSLENVGVSPDDQLPPTAADLHSGRDPALAHALSLLGEKVSPEEAGKFFPVQWPED